MRTDELAELRQQLATLHKSVMELVELQRQTIVALQSHSSTASLPDVEPILTNLNQLYERLAIQEPREIQCATDEKLHLRELEVERIDIVEHDGTLRMVISNTSCAPDPVMDGKVIGKRDGGDFAGIIFYNGEGDECGGLVYSGKREDGHYSAGANLLFDQFKQDQIVGIEYGEWNGQRHAGLSLWERPEIPLSEVVEKSKAIEAMPEGPEKAQAHGQLFETARLGPHFSRRVYVGKDSTNTAVVNLSDVKGRVRLRLAVDADGAPKLEFLNENGEVIASLPKDINLISFLGS